MSRLATQKIEDLKGLAADSLFVGTAFFLYWLFSNTSNSPGSIDPKSAYANMTGLYVYFLAFLVVFFIVDFSASRRSRLHFRLLLIVLASYPFLFVYTHHAAVMANPRTGAFPYYEAILYSRKIPWSQIFLDPWSVLASPQFGATGPTIFHLSAIVRTKMPGFALTAKLLSYVVFSQWTYLAAFAFLTVCSQLLIARALLSDDLKENKWYLVALLPATGFVIHPYGVEQLCIIYLALCLFFLHRFKKSGRTVHLLAGLLAGALLILNSAPAVTIMPFVAAFAMFDNPFKKKTILLGALLALLIVLAIHFYFTIATARQEMTLVDYYRWRGTAELALQVDRPQFWGIVPVLAVLCISWGPLLPVAAAHMIFRPFCKWTLFFLLSVLPVVAHEYFFGGGESYRHAYASHIVCLFVCVGFVNILGGVGDARSQGMRLKLLAGGSVLAGVLFHKLYAAPLVRLRPFGVDSPPHEMWGGWEYNLSRSQVVTPDLFLISFVIWALCLNLQRDVRGLFAAAGEGAGWAEQLRGVSSRSFVRVKRRRLAACCVQLLVISVFVLSSGRLWTDPASNRANLLVDSSRPRAWSYTKRECVEARVAVWRRSSLVTWSRVIHLYSDSQCPTFEMYQHIYNVADRRLRLEVDTYIGKAHSLAKSGFYVWFFNPKNQPVACLAIVVAGKADHYNPENTLAESGTFFRATKVVAAREGEWDHLSLDLDKEYDALLRTHLRENQERYLFKNLSISSLRFEIISWTDRDGKIDVTYDNLKLIPRKGEE
ncbi:MAG: hypothetical protein HY315_03490 [Acidobacteria bacterium]|nr:hypothetical protein [Acidobacteriota bacterium]